MKKEIRGCPVADGEVACPRCGGGWPGTRVTTETMEKGLKTGIIDPNRLGCQILTDRAFYYYEAVSRNVSID